MHNQKHNVSLFDNNRDIFVKEKSFTFEELYRHLEKESEKKFVSKDELSAIVCGTFIDKKRTAKNLLCRSIITYDIDYYNHDLDHLTSYIANCLHDYKYIYYTTSSSTFKTPKLRLLLFVDRDINNDDYKTVSKNIAKHFLAELFKESNYRKEKKTVDSAFDKCSYSPSYLMYLPINASDDFKLNKNNGKLIDIENHVNQDNDVENFCTEEFNRIPLAISDDKIKITLSNYDPTNLDYHEWLEVLLALHHQYEGGDDGLEILINWSLTDKKISEKNRYQKGNVEEVCTYKYRKLDLTSLDKIVKFSTIIYKSNLNKKIPVNFNIVNYKPIPLDGNIFVDFKWNKKTGEITGVKPTYNNFEAMCRYYNIEISYDIITKENVNSLNEKDQNSLNSIIQSTMILNNMDRGLTAPYIYLMANRNKINTVKIIMDNVIWDGQDRLRDFYNTVEVDDKYKDARDIYLLKWLKQSLYLVLHEGDRKICRNLLIFQGGQKGGKSTWVNNLLPKHLGDYIGEGLRLNLNNSTDLLSCLKKWYVELAELEQSFKITDINQWKAFFGRRKDELNIKYVASPLVVERTTSFIGTVNEVSFLKDKSGSTRFLVLPVKKLNGYHGIDMLQLKKQIIETSGYMDFELDDNECEMQRLINEDFEQPNILEEQFLNVFEIEVVGDGIYLNCTEIFEQIGYSKRDVNRPMQCDLANILRKYNFNRQTDTKKWNVKLKSDKNLK